MKKLVEYIVKEITGSDDFTVEETKEEGRVNLVIHASKDIIGMIIGKGGTTIKSIRNIVRVKSALEQTTFYLNVEEK